MSPLQWLAIPLIATLVAVVAVPFLIRRNSRVLSAQQRADVLRRALAPDDPRADPGAGG